MGADDKPVFEEISALDPLLRSNRRVLLWGAMGLGKSTLVRTLAIRGATRGVHVTCINADLGTPAFGPPGSVSLARWGDGDWRLLALEPLCTLDAARFRLPLAQAVGKIAPGLESGLLLIDPPGIVRGIAAAELLTALATIVDATDIVYVDRRDQPVRLSDELGALGRPVLKLLAQPKARGRNVAARARLRTRQWNAFLKQAQRRTFALDAMQHLGSPPPVDHRERWVGRQIAVGKGDAWHGFGEVTRIEGLTLEAMIVGEGDGIDSLLIRDAGRDAKRHLRTCRHLSRSANQLPRSIQAGPPKQASRNPFEVRCGPLVATLLNGVTGDPLLMVRQRHRRDAMLFDMGESYHVSRRVLHTVTDVFLTHAHLDHIAGFPDLLRSRLSAVLPPLRVYGPYGTSDHIAGFLAGVCWDRIGDAGPAFEVTELHGDLAYRFRLQAGCETITESRRRIRDGQIFETPELSVSAVELDHGIPVLAYACQLREELKVDPRRLSTMGLTPGPWLGDLKANVQRGALDAPVRLPDGTTAVTGSLAEQLIFTSKGPKVVYATDFDDNLANRQRLVDFAGGADLFFCESTFRIQDQVLAARTQHLITRACGEIARDAGVARLVPFHFSKRYEGKLESVYDEITKAFGGALESFATDER